jgi:hypothetical protein
MTVSELKNLYEYRLIEKYLKREFPFIIDFHVNQKDLDKFDYNIFINPIIDLIKVNEIYGWKVFWFVPLIDRPDDDEKPFAGIFDISYDEYKKTIRDPINELIEEVVSLDLPNQYKSGKNFSIVNFIIYPPSVSKLTPEMISKK